MGERSNRAQAKGKPLFQAAFLQFSANCDAGAYLVVRNPQNYPTETFFGVDPAQGAFDDVIR